MQARIENGSVRMPSKNGLDWTPRIAPIIKALQQLKVDSAIIDGEVVVQDVEYRGRTADGLLRQVSFKGIRERSKPWRGRAMARKLKSYQTSIGFFDLAVAAEEAA